MKTLGFVSLVAVTPVVLLGPPPAAQLPTLGLPLAAPHATFAPGDVFVSLETGQVQWRNPGGTLNAVLVGVVQGSTATGMRLDATGNLYVTHDCAADATCTLGNTVEKFNTSGVSQGIVASWKER